MDKTSAVDDNRYFKISKGDNSQDRGHFSGNPNFQIQDNPISKTAWKPESSRPKKFIPFEWGEERTHPLLIDHVLNIVLTKLPLGDLEQCQKVCAQWENQAAVIIDNRQSLLLRSNPSNAVQVQKYLKKFRKNEAAGIGSVGFVGLRIKPKTFPWSLIHQFGSTLDQLKLYCCSIPAADLPIILSKTSGIRILELRSIGLTNKTEYGEECYGVGSTMTKIKDFNYVLAQTYMPRLEELTIIDNPREDYLSITEVGEPGHWILPIYLTLLMTAFPNLKAMKLRCNVKGPANNEVSYRTRSNCNWLSTLQSLEVEPVKSGARNLDLEVFNALAFMAINLKTLTVEPWKCRCTSLLLAACENTLECMTMLLRMNSGCLKDLTFKIKPTLFSNVTPVLPMFMPELEALALSANLVGSLDHLKYFPKLKYLEIEEIETGPALVNLLAESGGVHVHLGVQSLKVIHWGDRELGRFARIFPNLRALDLTMLFNVFHFIPKNMEFSIKQIVKNFQDLEYLRLRFPGRIRSGGVSDIDIMGISYDNLKDGLETVETLFEKNEFSLCNLKRLKVVDFYPMENVHDISVQNVFSRLKHLEYLNLSTSKISSTSLELVARGFRNLKVLKLESCSQINQWEVDTLQKRRPDLKIIFSEENSEAPNCPRFRVARSMDHSLLICNCFKSSDVSLD